MHAHPAALEGLRRMAEPALCLEERTGIHGGVRRRECHGERLPLRRQLDRGHGQADAQGRVLVGKFHRPELERALAAGFDPHEITPPGNHRGADGMDQPAGMVLPSARGDDPLARQDDDTARSLLGLDFEAATDGRVDPPRRQCRLILAGREGRVGDELVGTGGAAPQRGRQEAAAHGRMVQTAVVPHRDVSCEEMGDPG